MSQMEQMVKTIEQSIPKSWKLLLRETDENSQIMHLTEINNLYVFLNDQAQAKKRPSLVDEFMQGLK